MNILKLNEYCLKNLFYGNFYKIVYFSYFSSHVTNSHLFFCTHYRNITLKLIVKHIYFQFYKKNSRNYCAK